MKRPITVLAIDDDRDDALLLQRYLAQLPDREVHFVHCADPVRGREELSRREVDITFIDYRLGSRTGLKLLEDIRTAGDLRPIIVLTGQGDEYVAAQAIRAGADELLLKADITPATLQAAIACAQAQFSRREETMRLAAGPEQLSRQLASLSGALARAGD